MFLVVDFIVACSCLYKLTNKYNFKNFLKENFFKQSLPLLQIIYTAFMGLLVCRFCFLALFNIRTRDYIKKDNLVKSSNLNIICNRLLIFKPIYRTIK
ncbi:hypothetical protein A0H76_1361 [Hepatospora eriocheir]|uniref:Uncharacterized protein n=1 Tax=Hepatospora eriocheir TaxID=1081669 RepID=A0A1X0QLM4_9MICR|nr:hypothetical protein A0H76_1361 [Hepatospora eriocheir]